MISTIDDEYDILMAVVDYIEPEDGNILTGNQVTLFSDITNELHKLRILGE